MDFSETYHPEHLAALLGSEPPCFCRPVVLFSSGLWDLALIATRLKLSGCHQAFLLSDQDNLLCWCCVIFFARPLSALRIN